MRTRKKIGRKKRKERREKGRKGNIWRKVKNKLHKLYRQVSSCSSLRGCKTFPWGLPLQMCDTPKGSPVWEFNDARRTPHLKALPASGKAFCELYTQAELRFLGRHLPCTSRKKSQRQQRSIFAPRSNFFGDFIFSSGTPAMSPFILVVVKPWES